MNPEYAAVGTPDVQLVEECAELITELGKLIQAIAKAQRFGWDKAHPVTGVTNVASVLSEMADVEARIAQLRARSTQRPTVEQSDLLRNRAAEDMPPPQPGLAQRWAALPRDERMTAIRAWSLDEAVCHSQLDVDAFDFLFAEIRALGSEIEMVKAARRQVFSKLCTRPTHVEGPCNGLPRDDCPTVAGTPKEIRESFGYIDADVPVQGHVVTCDEARFVAGNLDHGDATTLLRFIDQAAEREKREKQHNDTVTYLLGCQAASLAENAKLRAACEAALHDLGIYCCGSETQDQLREVLGLAQASAPTREGSA